MAGREYQGAGGLRLHLDEPLSDEMAKQVARGHLVPVDGEAPELEESSAPAEPDGDAKRPNANSPVADWRAYAVSLGMPEEEAATATKKECQEHVQVVEDAQGDSQVAE
ncbi:hypothetical protein O3Q52_01585 [Streptomyces sp. ActVer]|uniref:hypothetical protein n=1 Tax=Streptomyces sp. ActVer TaxID=3014558 RepID=UPI0022B44D92|nr:hypothetical protein [Streptomyces sp. ActVer]MCZ4506919.1 hypothetical protein [Streptomyces sp. ActVer]